MSWREDVQRRRKVKWANSNEIFNDGFIFDSFSLASCFIWIRISESDGKNGNRILITAKGSTKMMWIFKTHKRNGIGQRERKRKDSNFGSQEKLSKTFDIWRHLIVTGVHVYSEKYLCAIQCVGDDMLQIVLVGIYIERPRQTQHINR